MGRDEAKIKRFRKKLEKNGFFEDEIFDKSEFILQEQDGGISEWVYYLKKHEKLEVKKFKDLFSQLNEIIFPICYSSPQRLNYIRNLMGSFIEEYNIGHYKVNIGNLNRDEDIKVLIDEMREVVKIEGVLEELFISKGVKTWR